MAANTYTYAPSHLGLCVTDLERSMRFYCQGLGFAVGQRYDIDRQIAEVDPPCSLISQFISLGGLTIELLAYHTPGVFGRPSMRRNQIGLTHLSFIVDDVEEAAAALVDYGAVILPDTRSGQGDAEAVQILFVSDPDGVRVEMMKLPS